MDLSRAEVSKHLAPAVALGPFYFAGIRAQLNSRPTIEQKMAKSFYCVVAGHLTRDRVGRSKTGDRLSDRPFQIQAGTPIVHKTA
jgi:hypothetical protein